MKELFFSVDVESDGAIPIKFSMLSFGIAVFTEDGEVVDTFERNLETLDGAIQDPETMLWWDTKPEAWEVCRKNLVKPVDAMNDLTSWVESLCSKHNAVPVFLAYPAGFDFTFMYVYLIYFTGKSPFSFSALDIKSYAMALLGSSFRETTKRNIPKHLKSKRRHTHISLDDALGQGEMFMKMFKQNKANIEVIKQIEKVADLINGSK